MRGERLTRVSTPMTGLEGRACMHVSTQRDRQSMRLSGMLLRNVPCSKARRRGSHIQRKIPPQKTCIRTVYVLACAAPLSSASARQRAVADGMRVEKRLVRRSRRGVRTQGIVLFLREKISLSHHADSGPPTAQIPFLSPFLTESREKGGCVRAVCMHRPETRREGNTQQQNKKGRA